MEETLAARNSFVVFFSIVLLLVATLNLSNVYTDVNKIFRPHLRRQLLQFDDPKTVELKSEKEKPFFGIIGLKDLQETEERSDKYHHEAIISSAYNPNDIMAPEDLSQLRYVTFGSSHTWGAGVNREDGYTRYDAYPYLLSPNVTNLGIRAYNLEYPALCVNSMIKDNIYDVAIIMYPWYPRSYAGAHLGYVLRKRFPDMIIIYLHHVRPMQFTWVWKNGTEESLKKSWAGKHAPDLKKSDPLFLQKMKDYAEEHKSEGEWWFMDRKQRKNDDKSHLQLLPRMQYELGKNSFLVDIFADALSPFDYMENFANITCDNDYHHPCHIGHSRYAAAIQLLLQKIMSTNNYPINKPRIGEWIQHDTCNNWFEPDILGRETSDVDFPYEGFTFACFTREKCTLELVGNEGTKFEQAAKGSITVTNLKETEQHLAVLFMATNPSHDKISYPKTKVEILHSGKDGVVREKIADPITLAYGDTEVHVAKSLTLGKIPPGESIIRFQPLETDKKDPFRLVSYMITENEAVYQGVSQK